MAEFELMHKDRICGRLSIDEVTGRVIGYKDNGSGLSPYVGHADLRKIKQWWEMRAVPVSRTGVQKILKSTECHTTGLYLAKNLALSMTDTYWLRPDGTDLQYKDIKFSNLIVYHGGKVPYHNASSYDPNASLGGQMEKYWDLEHAIPILVKESYKHYGQQSVNEVFASRIHELQGSEIPFVRYTAMVTEEHGTVCKCEAFTSDKIEFIPAYEIVESQKGANDLSAYENYVELCVQYGIDRFQIQSFMDYQTMTDFVISNTDEHLANFGVLRDADTMEFIGPAPIFDSGNSMFFDEERKIPYSRAGLLGRRITSFFKTEDKMLQKVKNRSLVRIDLLPSASEVKELYQNAGIPERKAVFISQNYELKVQMLQEFQKGIALSLYQEQKREKEELWRKKQQEKLEKSGQSFIMLCGSPSSEKSAQAARVCHAMEKKGLTILDAAGLYPASSAMRDSAFLINKKQIIAGIKENKQYQNAVVLISDNEIRDELDEHSTQFKDDLVFYIAEMRTRIALMSGASVVYDALNFKAKDGEILLGIADEFNVKNKELLIMQSPEQAGTDIFSERPEILHQCLNVDSPSLQEGWTNIIKCVAENIAK